MLLHARSRYDISVRLGAARPTNTSFCELRCLQSGEADSGGGGQGWGEAVVGAPPPRRAAD
jgi:hypothetical protein